MTQEVDPGLFLRGRASALVTPKHVYIQLGIHGVPLTTFQEDIQLEPDMNLETDDLVEVVWDDARDWPEWVDGQKIQDEAIIVSVGRVCRVTDRALFIARDLSNLDGDDKRDGMPLRIKWSMVEKVTRLAREEDPSEDPTAWAAVRRDNSHGFGA